VVVQGAFGYPGPPENGLQTRRLKAPPIDLVEGRPEQLFPGDVRLTTAWPLGFLGMNLLNGSLRTTWYVTIRLLRCQLA
jgi:hypothetical protein